MDRNQALTQVSDEAGRGELQFPTNSRVTMKLRQTLDDPDCHLEAAGKLIEADPLLSAQVVALANSAAYNPSGREIADVRSAAARLGFATLRTLATARLTRQIADQASSPEQRRITAQLWQHSAHVGALARLIAKRISGQNPEAALFAGLVHEIGGFYLLSRSNQYPQLLEARPPAEAAAGGTAVDRIAVEHTLSLAILRQLAVPTAVIDAVEHCAQGYLAMPPRSLGDTLLLADYLASVGSPLMPAEAAPAALDFSLGDETLLEILEQSNDEVASLTRALES